MNPLVQRKFLLGAIILSALIIFWVRVELYNRAVAAETVPSFVGTSVVARGVVVDDPDKRSTSTHVTVAVTEINNQPASGNLLALVPRTSVVSHNDTVEVKGVLVAPETFQTNTGRTFDYPGYLRVRGVGAVIERATLVSQHPGGFSVLGILFSIKHAFESVLERNISEPQVSLLEGMLLGERGGFSQLLLQAFVVTGLIHVVVLSGSNISIVSEGVFRAFGFLPRWLGYSLGAVAIILFAMMSGGGAATVRAVIMGGIALVARYFHRPVLALRSLFVAAVLMVLWKPPVLLYDNGFILSVLATFGMITLAPWFEQKLYRLPAPEKFNLRSIVATTLGVEVFILPALLYFSGVLSFISVPLNALVLPLVPVVMLLGFVVGVLGFIHPLLAFVPAFVCDMLLRLILWITETATALPFGSAVVPEFSFWIVAVVYVPLTWFAFVTYKRQIALRSQTN